MSDLEVRAAKSLLASKSASGSAGKAMVVGGVSTLGVALAASLIPFVGTLTLAILLVATGLFLWE